MEVMPITPALRSALFAVWSGKCAYCGGAAEHVDHLQPRARGGEDCLVNYVPACTRCNLTKSALEIDEAYLGLLRARISSRLPKVTQLIAKETSGKKRRPAPDETKGVVRVDFNIPMSAILWTARQSAEQWMPEDHSTGRPLLTGMVMLEPARNATTFAAYAETVPVWSNPYKRCDLVQRGVSPGFPYLLAEAELVPLARTAVQLGYGSFEYDGRRTPRSAEDCKPCPTGYGLPLPRKPSNSEVATPTISDSYQLPLRYPIATG